MSLSNNYKLFFPKSPLIINNETTPEQFYDEYLFGMNHHLRVKGNSESYPGSLLLTPGQMKSYLSIILENELPLLETLQIDLSSR